MGASCFVTQSPLLSDWGEACSLRGSGVPGSSVLVTQLCLNVSALVCGRNLTMRNLAPSSEWIVSFASFLFSFYFFPLFKMTNRREQFRRPMKNAFQSKSFKSRNVFKIHGFIKTFIQKGRKYIASGTRHGHWLELGWKLKIWVKERHAANT